MECTQHKTQVVRKPTAYEIVHITPDRKFQWELSMILKSNTPPFFRFALNVTRIFRGGAIPSPGDPLKYRKRYAWDYDPYDEDAEIQSHWFQSVHVSERLK